jgi:hypothetical protein
MRRPWNVVGNALRVLGAWLFVGGLEKEKFFGAPVSVKDGGSQMVSECFVMEFFSLHVDNELFSGRTEITLCQGGVTLVGER